MMIELGVEVCFMPRPHLLSTQLSKFGQSSNIESEEVFWHLGDSLALILSWLSFVTLFSPGLASKKCRLPSSI